MIIIVDVMIERKVQIDDHSDFIEAVGVTSLSLTLSPLMAFFTLSVTTNVSSTTALGINGWCSCPTMSTISPKILVLDPSYL